MDFSMEGLQSRLQQGLRTAAIASALIIVITALVLYMLLSWLFITPMERIAQGILRFSQGNRSERVPIQTQDEVGLLASVFNQMANTIQEQETTANRLYQEIQAKEIMRRQLLDRLTTAREDEQKRLARRIHDEVGQLLTGLSLHLKLCEQAVPDTLAAAHTHLGKATALVQRTLDQTHVLIRLLRPTVLDDYGLAPAVQEEITQRLQPLGVQAHLEIEGDLELLTAEMATVAFRIIQEAVINVIRHAQARHVWIRMQSNTDGFVVTVEDDGVGLPSKRETQGWGILGMQERAAALGGTVEVLPRYPQGTRVHLWLPGKETGV
jgi:signal transduction histidine kinase